MARHMSRPRILVVSFLAIACWCETTAVLGRTVDFTPKTAILLNDSSRFIVQDSDTSVAIYRVSDASIIRRYSDLETILKIAISPDEKQLLIGFYGGTLTMWNIESGEVAWELNGTQSGVSYPSDISFAQNGERVAICGNSNLVLVVETKTGKILQQIKGKGTIGLAALSPNGISGILADNDHLFNFDVATGQSVATGLPDVASYPRRQSLIQYSVDGKYIAFPVMEPRGGVHLVVVTMEETRTQRVVGHFYAIGHITPAKDGSFLITGESPTRGSEGCSSTAIGVRVWPESGQIDNLWTLPCSTYPAFTSDYRPDSLIGVSTGVSLRTWVFDLRTGTTLFTLNGPQTSFIERNQYWIIFAVAASAIAIYVYMRRRRTRRVPVLDAPPGTA